MEGLRTLVLAVKKIEPKYFAEWNKKYDAARAMLDDKAKYMEELHSEIETELEIIGATAIEDRLQDDVRKLISSSRLHRADEESRHQSVGPHRR